MVPEISGGQMKRMVRRGRGSFPSAMSLASRRIFEDRGGAAGVIVRTGLLVAEVATEDDFAGIRIGASDDSGDDFEIAGLHLCGDLGVKLDLFAVEEARLEFASLMERDHEGEGVLSVVRREVAPADDV